MTQPETQTPNDEQVPAPTARRSRRWPWLITAAVAALAVVGLAVVFAAAVTPCESDDAASNLACHWDASEQGDGQGDDFMAFGYGRWVIYR